MKDLKKKLTAAGAMLVVSAVMLSGVSYAWFTLSTNPEVKGIKATATSNASLEIAYNELSTAPTADENNTKLTGKSDTYGNLVTMGAKDDSSSQSAWTGLEKVLRPMKYSTNNKFQYMKYGEDGRQSELADLSLASATTSTEGGVKDACGNIQLNDNGKTVNYGYYVRYWMRTNNKGDNNIVLTTAQNRSNDEAAAQGSGTSITLTINDKSSLSENAMEELIKHVRLGFSNSVIGNNTTPKAVSSNIAKEIDPSSWTVTKSTDKKSVTLTLPTQSESDGTSIGINLEQNVDTAVYMYVYLDGTTMGNDLANAVKDGNAEITVNTQFSNSNMDDSMGMTATGTTK